MGNVKRKAKGESVADRLWLLAQGWCDKADQLRAESDKAKDYFTGAGVGKAYKALGYQESALKLMAFVQSLSAEDRGAL